MRQHSRQAADGPRLEGPNRRVWASRLPGRLVPCERLRSGFATAVSRARPLRRFGVGNLMGMCGGVCALGWLISLALAPETRRLVRRNLKTGDLAAKGAGAFVADGRGAAACALHPRPRGG